jgi:ribonuclease HI
LGLNIELSQEWDAYTKELILSGIRLNKEKDFLHWSWNRSTGTVTASSAYYCILYTSNCNDGQWWHKTIWSVKVAVKIICFLWLCLEDRLLTGINFQKRGGIGPSVCTLCLKAEESVTHLFVDCQITQMIWGQILTSLRIDFEWNKDTIEENLKFWFLKLPNHKHIPLLLMWEIWKFRNRILFDNLTKNVQGLYQKILTTLQEHLPKEEADKTDILLNPTYFNNNPIGFFDGAASTDICGIGIYLKITPGHNIQAHFAGGTGNNIKAELLGLWGLLYLATHFSIKNLMVAGDSKVTIDWISDKAKLEIIYLSHWKDMISNLKQGFETLNFMHIHRQFNKIADSLSKKALKDEPGWHSKLSSLLPGEKASSLCEHLFRQVSNTQSPPFLCKIEIV